MLASEALQKAAGTKKKILSSFHPYSWNSEVETTWKSLIDWRHRTFNIYLLQLSKNVAKTVASENNLALTHSSLISAFFYFYPSANFKDFRSFPPYKLSKLLWTTLFMLHSCTLGFKHISWLIQNLESPHWKIKFYYIYQRKPSYSQLHFYECQE